MKAIRDVKKEIKNRNKYNERMGDECLRKKDRFENNHEFITEKNLFFDNIEMNRRLKANYKK